MRIQHNIMAMNAYRNYNTNTSALSKNLEKLSSGYKINRAGDDAAGLAISEKMRAQITGLNAAQKNVKDGISLVKTAEGAMQEIQDMLNRMDYLATQSANGTYDNEVDRANLQKEVDALKEEIDRIADSANFNGIKLLDGSLDPVAAAKNNAAEEAKFFSDVNVTAKVDAVVAADPQALNFEVDLSNLSVTFKGVASGSTAATRTATITIAGQTFNVKKQMQSGTADETVTGEDLVALIASAATTATIGSATFDIATDGAKITFSMQTDAANIAKYKASTALTATATVAATQGTLDKGFTNAVNITQEYVKGGNMVHAQGSFTLAKDQIVDGAKLKIGDQTFIFKVGKDGKGGEGGTVIDLSDVEAGASNIAILAATRLSAKQNPGAEYTITADGASGKIQLTTKDGFDYSKADMVGPKATGAADATWKTGDGKSVVQFMAPSANTSTTPKQAGKLTLQIGDTSDNYNRLDVEVGDMHCDALGIGKKGSGIDISTPEGAKTAIDTIKKAINTVSGVRGDLGAVQNRLEHTANNLSVMAENIQDAESTIRDTDVAEEMMAYTKNNILIQSAQAMLAQANAVPQGVLQLLG